MTAKDDSLLQDIRDSVIAMRQTNEHLAKISDTLQTNLKNLNDSFILHSSENREQHIALKDGMNELNQRHDKYMKWLIIALIAASGLTGILSKIV